MKEQPTDAEKAGKTAKTSLAKSAERVAKIHQVATWILEGNPKEAIEEAIRETWPDEKEKPLIVAAMASIKRSAKNLRSNAAEWCLESLRFLYQKQVEIGEYAGAMRAVKQISDMVTPKTQSERPSSNVNVQVNIADARRTEIREVVEQVRTRLVSLESPT